jgi:hypothetical protein
MLTVSFTVVGGVIVWHRPTHLIGWLFYWIGLTSVLQLTFTEYGYYSLYTIPGVLPFGLAAVWLQHWMWVLFISSILIFIPLLFPDGHLLSRRWRIVAWLGFILTGAISLIIALENGPLQNFNSIPNPLAIELTRSVTDDTEGYLMIPLIVLALFSAGSTVIRYRNAARAERQQIKWLALAFILVPVGLGLTGNSDSIWVVFVGELFVALVPVLVGVGILRYQLFDIDLVFNRALVYGLLTILLGLTYFALVTLLQNLLSVVTGQRSTIAIVISTLAIAALFSPFRRRIQNLIDRRFYRRKYDGEKALASFSLTVRDEVDLENLSHALLAIVDSTMEPVKVSLWLLEGTTDDRLQTVYGWQRSAVQNRRKAVDSQRQRLAIDSES